MPVTTDGLVDEDVSGDGWEENYLQDQLDVVVLLDRGYHIASVIRFLLNMGLSIPWNAFRECREMALLHRR
jgi:hypothetical protein